MAKTSFSNIFDVTLDSKKIPPDYIKNLVGGWVDLGAGVPAEFRLTFRDPDRNLFKMLNVKFGSEVVLAPVADGKGTATPLLTGEVTGMEADYDGTGTFAVIRGYDAGHRLMRVRRVASYRNQTASDIAIKLAKANGIKVGKVEGTETLYEFISQSNVTDWDFLARLADENAVVMSLDSKGRLRFTEPDPASKAPPAGPPDNPNPRVLGRRDVLRCRAAVTAADQVAKVEARGWNVTTKKKIVVPEKAGAYPGVAIGTTPQKAATAFKAAKLVETDTPYDREPETKFAASSLADDITSSFAELEVMVRGNPALRPGVAITLADVGFPFEGKYTVTSARHTFSAGSHYETWVTVSGRQWRSLFGLTSGGGGSAPRLPSVANALVTDVQDPLQQGRVKLQFPWLDDAYVSDWTRTVQLGGKKGGGVFPMDVGDEVLVGFDRGALDHPFVIGGLYNGIDKPNVVKKGPPLHDPLKKQAIRHTVSDRDGNRMDLLSQKTGTRQQGVRLASGNDRLIINLDRTKTEITVDSKGAVSITGGTSVSIDAGTSLSLSARTGISIKSGGPLTLQGRGIVNLKSLGGPVTVDAMGALNLKSIGAAMLTAGGTVQVNTIGQVGMRAVNIDLMGLVTVNKKPYPIP